MIEALSFLALPALACAALVAIHAYFGLQVLERNVIFVDLALAQVAALGATAAFLLGHPPQGLAAHAYALGFTVAAAALLASTRAWSGRIPQEAQIGVVYVVAAAAALLLVDRAPQGAEHIRQILTGNILTVGWSELAWAIALYAAVGLAYPRIARVLKPSGWISEFAFYAAFGVVVTSSVALAGVLLVFAFLIIPAAIGVLHATRFASQLAIAWIAGTAAAFVGLAISYASDLSTGATLVCTYGAALAMAGVARALRQERGAKLGAALRLGRWLAAALLATSGIWIAISPRADQPVLDSLERAFPAIRGAYMDAKSLAIGAEAAAYGRRYRDEADKLRAREAERRWKGEPLDEE
ncbi:MAG TPA: metal ABC transporter permease, partial [Usitatibacter sp.]